MLDYYYLPIVQNLSMASHPGPLSASSSVDAARDLHASDNSMIRVTGLLRGGSELALLRVCLAGVTVLVSSPGAGCFFSCVHLVET